MSSPGTWLSSCLNIQPRLAALPAVLLATGFLVVAALPAAAASEPSIDCENASSTVEMNHCADQEFEKVDAELNAIYKKALAAIPDMATEHPFDTKSWEAALRSSQRAWLAYRDAECDQHVPMFWGGGTGTSSAVTGCKTQRTRARIEELKASYEAD